MQLIINRLAEGNQKVQQSGHFTLLKNGKFKGCVTTEILIVDSTRPVASIFKLKSIKGVALETMKVIWDCGNGN